MTKAIAFIEVDVTFCALRYGETTGAGTCPAVLGVDSDIKCFNSLATCPVRDSFLDDPVTLRFAEDSGFHKEAGIDCIASIKGIAYTPATVSLGKDLGTRASLSVTFKDHPWPDTVPGYDKYVSERPYDPVKRGSYWGKFRARQPFLRGRAMRLIRGEVGQDLADMETRHYLIESFGHNAADGTFQIVGKDLLKFADDDRAQAPRASQGFLISDISDTDTTAQLSPAGIGNLEYPSTGHVAIAGKEIVAYERDLYAGNDADTKLLIRASGADASQVFTDISSSAHVVTAFGNAQVDTAQSKFASGRSVLLDGSGDLVFLSDHADWTPAGNFTFDMWARWNALASTQWLFSHGVDANNVYGLTVSSTGVLTFTVRTSSVNIVTMSSAAGVVTTGAWYHIAVVRSGNSWRIYVNGVSVASVTDSDAVTNYAGFFRIGTDVANGTGFNGWWDEFRLSHVARWTAAFDPPEAPYQASSDLLTITRAQLNTEAIAHEAQDRVQVVLSYEAQDGADIIRDLLVNYAAAPDAYIPLAAWKIETASFLNRVFTAHIAEPTGVAKLIKELIKDAALSLWWDDVTPELRLRVLRAIATGAFTFDQSTYEAGTFASREQPNERLSQVWRFFAKRNPLEGHENEDNYRSVAVTADLEAEADHGSPVIDKIFSRWIPFGGRSIAEKANDLHLSRFVSPPRRFNFASFRNGLIVPELGQGYRVKGLGLQDDTGAAVSAPIQITRLDPGATHFDIEAQEMLVAEQEPEDLVNRVIVIDGNVNNENARTRHDTLYPAPTDQDVIDGVNLKVYVVAGVIVGSDSAPYGSVLDPALDIGTWPTGFPITLIVNGSIRGGGGRGGTTSSNNNGQAGGTALYTRHPIDLEIGTGSLWAGGGGGGSGAYQERDGVFRTGCGGGGGAGTDPGPGGAGQSGTSNPAGSPGTATAGGAGGIASFTNRGGDGGARGVAGSAGNTQGGGFNLLIAAGGGGAAGNAIDGVSFVTVTVGPGDIVGPQVN